MPLAVLGHKRASRMHAGVGLYYSNDIHGVPAVLMHMVCPGVCTKFMPCSALACA